MINENTTSNRRVGVDINLKDLRDLRLDKEGQQFLALFPQPVRHSITLQCMKALEIQEYIRQTSTSRITFSDRHDICAQRAAQDGIRFQCFQYHGLQLRGDEFGGGLPIFHFDFYRLESEEEALALGWEEYLAEDAVLAVEWPDKYPNLLPEGTRWIQITILSDGKRQLEEITPDQLKS